MSAAGGGVCVRVRIIGIGSPSAGDDAGWRLARALQGADLGRGFADGTVETVLCGHPGDLLLGPLQGLALAVLIDAMCTGASPGSLRLLEMEDLVEGPALTSHGFGVARILALGRALGALPPRLILYGIETGPPQAMPAPATWVKQCAGVLRAEIRQALGRAQGPSV